MDAFATLAAAGFDIAHRFDAGSAAREPGLAMLAGQPRLGILIGNTRALWRPFTAAMCDPALAAESDPLDRYTERVIGAAFAPAAAGSRIYYGHRRYDRKFVPLQPLAVITGLGALAPNHLVIHPIYGPWFALRAVVVTDGDPPERQPIAQPCQCDAPCREHLARAQRSLSSSDWLAVRDSCSLRAWRYTDDQVRYHYARVRWPLP